jgi:hypothetical protein
MYCIRMWEWGYISLSLTSEIDGGEWLASSPCRPTPGIHLLGGWVCPRAGLDAVGVRNIFPLSSLLLQQFYPTCVPKPGSRYEFPPIRHHGVVFSLAQA